MKNLGFTLAAAALLAVGSPQQAKALDLGLFCGGNGLTTCAAAQVTSAGGWLQIDVLNLSGWNGTPENTVFTKIGLNNISFATVSNLQVSFAGGAWEAASDYGWGFSNTPFGGGFSAETTAAAPNPNSAIASDCANSPPGGLGAQWFTPGCTDGSVDYTKAISFRFQYTGMTGSLSDVDVLLRGQNVGFGDDVEGSLVCDTGGNCVPTTVVPEPTTMILLGTGLAGVIGTARRKKNGVELETEEEQAV